MVSRGRPPSPPHDSPARFEPHSGVADAVGALELKIELVHLGAGDLDVEAEDVVRLQEPERDRDVVPVCPELVHLGRAGGALDVEDDGHADVTAQVGKCDTRPPGGGRYSRSPRARASFLSFSFRRSNRLRTAAASTGAAGRESTAATSSQASC